MPNPFDAANKHLVQAHPADWLMLADLPTGTSIQMIDADLSAVSAAADKLFRVDGPSPYVAHHDFQSGPDDNLDMRVLTYNVLARRVVRLSVKSVVFALRPQAVTPAVLGKVSDITDAGFGLQFEYKLVRVWELPPEKLLTGGIGTLPLAPISAVKRADLPSVIDAMAKRFAAEAPSNEIADLWSVTRILMGLKWPRTVIGPLLKGVLQMKESDTYQEIIEEGVEKGREQEARSLILRSGSRKFGPPGAFVQSRLESINNLMALEAMMDRLVDGGISNWADLLSPVS